jgi:hypothetical protein
MKRFSKAAAAFGAFAAAVIVPAVPTISTVSAAEAPMGYVVTEAEVGCELQQVDLTTGALTDLPAPGSEDACAVDLAVAPSGVVYGISLLDAEGGGPQLVTYAADGTPTITPITVTGDAQPWMAQGGIAVSAGGTVYVQLVARIPGCDTGTTPDTLLSEPLYEGDSVCLFTLDPSSGAATLVGTTGLFETYFWSLTSCASTLRTLYVDDRSESIIWATESAATGAVTPGAEAVDPVAGYDCASTSDTLYAVTNPGLGIGLPGSVSAPTAEGIPGVGTVDPATGVYTENAELSDPEAFVLALAVTPAAPAPTTTTTTGDVAAVEVTPAFTG